MAKTDHKTSQENETLVSPNQQLAIDALLAGGTDSEAAEAAGVRRETVCRWRHSDADFIAALNRARSAAFDAAADSLRRAVPKAISTVVDILSDEDPSLRLKAASILLAQLCEVQAPGDTDAEEIRTKQVEARGERDQRAFRAQLL